jgi:hypothetical protein
MKELESDKVLKQLIGKSVPFDETGKIKIMAVADGYCMVRRPGCVPSVFSSSALALHLALNLTSISPHPKKPLPPQ